ncbi:N-6 DNA methylase [Thiothrix lacustris]|uniref:site-specific DNA-methyltransferase (adenine-specific) n=1 Tax=Thiothrix lacustris TaxID=525917 RepID=A0ABY9MS29_9GAMM|nr:N-6 DNA methylase [Thiothrix lacustris]WML91011.1 N-6 DNA methylase [Thiothrix lacustris]
MRQALDKALRKHLENAVVKAREIAEQAATETLERLGVGEGSAPGYLSEEQRQLRNRLRAHGRALGDVLAADGSQETVLLTHEIAYEHWHRMLFARFLEQNHLLMYDVHTSVTLEECAELAEDEADCADGWEFAGRLAQKMLPQIFRVDSPVLAFKLPINHIRSLEGLVMGLDAQTFQASDSLGWCYQFWQSKRKDEVNASGVKIGAREISPVTQLFTEPYMVSFLLDNALGAWWAKRRLTQDDLGSAHSEKALREWAALEGVPLDYLRFVRGEEAGAGWAAAAGWFEQWPEDLAELKVLDPCCGSGHFLVAVFLMLVPMRMALEGLSAQAAVDAVLRQNIHGLELDQRCVELAAFALALEAWRYPDAGKYRALPELQLACTGLSVKAAKAEWKALGLDKKNLSIALDWMYDTFEQAPVLGSLINPRKSNAAKLVAWDELQPMLDQALQHEENRAGGDAPESTRHEAGIVASGLVKAASLLASQYHWVVTNVPYLARGKQDDVLKDFCENQYPAGKNDLATVFLDRCLELCVHGGTSSIVLPQNWLFLTSYKKFREKMLKQHDWHLLARLGEHGFDSSSAAGAFTAMISISRGQDSHQQALLEQTADSGVLRGVDVSDLKTAEAKATQLMVDEVKTVGQAEQLENPDSRIILEGSFKSKLLLDQADCWQGLVSSDDNKFLFGVWELPERSEVWEWIQMQPQKTTHYDGLTNLIRWENAKGALHLSSRAHNFPSQKMRGKTGVVFQRMRNLNVSLFGGNIFTDHAAPVVPKDTNILAALFVYATSDKYREEVRKVDSTLKASVGSFIKVPFDLGYWQGVAEEQYPHGLPQPYSDDPTQWIFHGHPCGSVIWDETEKKTAHGTLRQDDSVLQVAVARLLGYRWPAEQDKDMELAPPMREWLARCAAFDQHVDDDGIVCLDALRGEKRAADRLEAILQTAYGDQWSASVLHKLLQSVGSSNLENWLRDKYFEQHCKTFQHRPFIWHLWDGLKDGFSALVNYHTFDQKGLERLIYTYLGDWIRQQEQGVHEGIDGADTRLTAAKNLKDTLEKIKTGEKGLDIFVRWKPLHQQPIGWNPDLNDGVRLNIRPFLQARDVGKKGAGILRAKPNIDWKKDRGNDVESAPWYKLGLQYGEKEGARINDHHLSLQEKQEARAKLS